jgi:hypothetical protein
MKSLCEYGADVNRVNKEGLSVFMMHFKGAQHSLKENGLVRERIIEQNEKPLINLDLLKLLLQ